MKIFNCHLVFLKTLNERRLLSFTTYVTNANTAVTSAQFLSFLQNEGKWIKICKKTLQLRLC